MEQQIYRYTWENLQPDCLADRPVTGPRQSTKCPEAQKQAEKKSLLLCCKRKSYTAWTLACCKKGCSIETSPEKQ
eukprot:1155650-Pelagomonas_calceolata.AAC.4